MRGLRCAGSVCKQAGEASAAVSRDKQWDWSQSEQAAVIEMAWSHGKQAVVTKLAVSVTWRMRVPWWSPLRGPFTVEDH